MLESFVALAGDWVPSVWPRLWAFVFAFALGRKEWWSPPSESEAAKFIFALESGREAFAFEFRLKPKELVRPLELAERTSDALV